MDCIRREVGRVWIMTPKSIQFFAKSIVVVLSVPIVVLSVPIARYRRLIFFLYKFRPEGWQYCNTDCRLGRMLR